MASLVGAVTALTALCLPGVPYGDFTGRTIAAGGRPDDGQFTKLASYSLPGSAATDYSKVIATFSRPNDGQFTQLTPLSLPGIPYGDFTGKTQVTSYEKLASMSIVPIVTIGDYTDVDVDISMVATPAAAQAMSTAREISASMSIIPVATQARSGTTIAGTFPRTASMSIVPAVDMTVVTDRTIAASMSIVPAVALVSTVDTAAMAAAATMSAIPSVVLATSVNVVADDRAVSLSAIPAIDMNVSLTKIASGINWGLTLDVQPQVSMYASVQTAGEVDRIRITAGPTGHIRIEKV